MGMETAPFGAQSRAPLIGWWALGVFTVALLLSYADRQVLNLLVDPVRRDLAISDTQISLLQGAAFGVFYALGGVPFGRAADILPRRWVIAFGVLAWSAATFACGLSTSFHELFVARVLVGIGEAALLPAAMSIIANYFPSAQRGTAIGVLLVGAAAGTGVSTFMAGQLIAGLQSGALAWIPFSHGVASWREAFFLISLPGLPVALLALTVGNPGRSANGSARLISNSAVFKGFSECGPGLLLIYLAIGALTISNFALLTWTPVLLMRQFGMSPGAVGNSFGPVALVMGITGTLLTGIAGDQIVRLWGAYARLLFAAGVTLLGLASIFIGVASSAAAALALIGVSSFGSTAALTLCSASLQDIVPDQIRGVATALVSLMATAVGLGTAPTLVALATRYFYGPHSSVGFGMATVAPPAAAAATVLLWGAWAFLIARVNIDTTGPDGNALLAARRAR